MPRQIDNQINPQAHYDSTVPEICQLLPGEIDILVASIGTGGTITGVGRYLRKHKRDIFIAGVEPVECPIPIALFKYFWYRLFLTC